MQEELVLVQEQELEQELVCHDPSLSQSQSPSRNQSLNLQYHFFLNDALS